MQPTEQNPQPGAPRVESTDISARPVFLFGVALLVAAVVISAVLWAQFQYLDRAAARRDPEEDPILAEMRRKEPPRMGQPDPVEKFPEPRLQSNAVIELDRIRFTEQRKLSTYGWVDPKAGVVWIPIERAIELTAERGLPVRPQPQATQKKE
ncbi:MAG TPA: hypothetical protein VNK82_00740 [Terriglobales bacterium]|nr:hypothetical protein [Terriglobales bacterium]